MILSGKSSKRGLQSFFMNPPKGSSKGFIRVLHGLLKGSIRVLCWIQKCPPKESQSVVFVHSLGFHMGLECRLSGVVGISSRSQGDPNS